MAGIPEAEIEVAAGLVRRLLAEQCPDLAGLPLRQAAHGWDNVIYRLGEDLAVRLPRRETAARLVRHEQDWLPGLAARLQVPTSAPLRCGKPSALFPWHWSVVRWFEGPTAADLPPARRRQWAGQLAAVVDRLQQPAPAEAPANPVRGVPLAARDLAVRQRLGSGAVPHPARALALWEESCAAPPWPGPALWLHGDLHPANLITSGGRLAAVVDFGDITAGDPATDLAAAWLVFDGAGRQDFRAALQARRRIDTATWQRARGWALNIATALLANSDDSPVLRRAGEAALGQVLDPAP